MVQRWPYQNLPINNSMWVTSQIYSKHCSIYAFILYNWQDVSNIEDCGGRQSHHICSYYWQGVSDMHILWMLISSCLFLWPTACEWYSMLCERQSHDSLSCDQQQVSDIAHCVKGSPIASFPNRKQVTLHMLWKAPSSHLFLWPTACKWHCRFYDRQSHDIFYSD